MRTTMRRMWIPLLALAIAACSQGGGGSDSGGGGTTAPPPGPQPPVEDFSGTYDGSLTITFSAIGISTTETQAIRILIDSTGLVTIGVPPSASDKHLPQCGDVLQIPSAQLVGNTFTWTTSPVTCLLEGFECTFADTGTGV
ncbi:MAG: hypothetical protein LJE84_06700, partial [Gammaproteobacteria bacterium]|nr:hypothetical protein [Gammaproteobacteria bacterium]